MEKFDIIIQAGQSNAEGIGKGDVAKAFQPSARIYSLSADKVGMSLPDGMKVVDADEPFHLQRMEERLEEGENLADFSLSFSALYEKNCLKADRTVLVIRAAVGGTGFQKGHWAQDGILYLKMLEMIDYALSLNPENRLVAFLWHQGEHDAFEHNEPERFEQQLKSMIRTVRECYNAPNLPFIAGDFVGEWKNKNLSDCIPIVEKIKKVTEEIGNGAFVETSDLLSNNQAIGNGDDIHFCRAAQYTLGERYFQAFEKMKRNNFAIFQL